MSEEQKTYVRKPQFIKKASTNIAKWGDIHLDEDKSQFSQVEQDMLRSLKNNLQGWDDGERITSWDKRFETAKKSIQELYKKATDKGLAENAVGQLLEGVFDKDPHYKKKQTENRVFQENIAQMKGFFSQKSIVEKTVPRLSTRSIDNRVTQLLSTSKRDNNISREHFENETKQLYDEILTQPDSEKEWKEKRLYQLERATIIRETGKDPLLTHKNSVGKNQTQRSSFIPQNTAYSLTKKTKLHKTPRKKPVKNFVKKMLTTGFIVGAGILTASYLHNKLKLDSEAINYDNHNTTIEHKIEEQKPVYEQINETKQREEVEQASITPKSEFHVGSFSKKQTPGFSFWSIPYTAPKSETNNNADKKEAQTHSKASPINTKKKYEIEHSSSNQENDITLNTLITPSLTPPVSELSDRLSQSHTSKRKTESVEEKTQTYISEMIANIKRRDKTANITESAQPDNTNTKLTLGQRLGFSYQDTPKHVEPKLDYETKVEYFKEGILTPTTADKLEYISRLQKADLKKYLDKASSGAPSAVFTETLIDKKIKNAHGLTDNFGLTTRLTNLHSIYLYSSKNSKTSQTPLFNQHMIHEEKLQPYVDEVRATIYGIAKNMADETLSESQIRTKLLPRGSVSIKEYALALSFSGREAHEVVTETDNEHNKQVSSQPYKK